MAKRNQYTGQRLRWRHPARWLGVLALACGLAHPPLSQAAPGDVLFSDDFESGSLGAAWTVTGSGDAGVGTHTASSGTHSLYTRWGSVSVSSQAIDLSTVAGAELSLWIRRGADSFSEDPDSGEGLVIEYRTGGGSWAPLETFVGDEAFGESFDRTYPLPGDALHSEFRVRVRQLNGSGADWDYWHVDDVHVVETGAPSASGGFCDDFEGGLGRWTVSDPATVGTSRQTFNSANHALFLRWFAASVTSEAVDLSSVSAGEVTLWVRRGADSFSEDPDNNEDLYIEYRDAGGVWHTLDTLTGNGPSGEIFDRAYALPMDALHAALQVRLRTTGDDGADYDYWHIDDVCIQPFVPPEPVAYYAMDESAWDGSAGEVTDGTGNGNDARAVGAATTVDPGKVCLGGDVPANSSDAVQDGVDTGVDMDSDVGNRGTIDFWYKSNVKWNGGGARQLLDASLDSTGKYFYLTLTNSGKLVFALEDSDDGDYEVETSPQGFDAGEWVHVAVTWNLPGDRLEIYVNGALEEVDTPGTNGMLGDVGTLYLGDNRSDYHPDGTENSADGVLDEVRIYSDVLGAGQIQADMNATHACAPVIDHYRILHDGSALTCQPENVTVQACQDADCTAPYTETVDVTLSPTGWVGGDDKSFSGGSGVFELRHTTAEDVSLGIASASLPAVNPYRCFDSGVEGSCTLTFHDAGFAFDVPDQVACQDSATVTVAAVRKSDTGEQCTPGFADTTKSVSFWSTYTSPATPVDGQPLLVNGVAVSGSSPGTPIDLAFDGNGEAQLTVHYDEAGQLQLDARYEGSADDAGLVMTGNDLFVVRPDRFVLRATTDGTTDLGNATASGDPKWQAGRNFRMQVRASCADGTVTQNYEPGNPEMFVEMVNPPEGTAAAAGRLELKATTFDGSFTSSPGWQSLAGLFTEGVIVSGAQPPGDLNSYADAAFDEVGVVAIHVRDANYLGTAVPANTLTVGRFIPARFNVTDNAPAFRDATAPWSCGFSYMGQPFGYSTAPQLTVDALNTSGALTQNYAGAFWKLVGNPLDTRSYTDVSGSGLTVSQATVGTTSVTGPGAGTADYGLTGETLTYQRTEVAPFDAQVDLDVTAAVLTDDDGVCYTTSGVRCNVNDGDSAEGYTIGAITGTNLRFGRLAMVNAIGPEVIDLNVPMRAEYYVNANDQFVTHTDDSCTTPVTLTLSDADPGDNLTPGETCVWDDPNASGAGCTGTGPAAEQYALPPSGGVFNLWLQAPGSGNDGGVDITAAPPTWLQYDWGSGAPEDPSARGIFGIYRGEHGIIFQREVY